MLKMTTIIEDELGNAVAFVTDYDNHRGMSTIVEGRAYPSVERLGTSLTPPYIICEMGGCNSYTKYKIGNLCVCRRHVNWALEHQVNYADANRLIVIAYWNAKKPGIYQGKSLPTARKV